MEKKGQVTLFVIIAIVIIVGVVLIYFFYPGISSNLGGTLKNPSAYMQSCLEDKILDTIDIVSLQGGSIEPSNYFLYKNNKVGYLCFTNLYYSSCVVQIPFIESHIDNEIKEAIKTEVSNCLDEMEQSYESRGYTVNLQKKDFYVEIEPKEIVVNLNSTLSLQKENTEQYDSIRISVNNNLYELVGIAQSILNWEIKFGDTETTTYMDYYPNIKVEKYKQTDGTKIYIITNRDTGEKFQFATRSFAWPPGYGIQ